MYTCTVHGSTSKMLFTKINIEEKKLNENLCIHLCKCTGNSVNVLFHTDSYRHLNTYLSTWNPQTVWVLPISSSNFCIIQKNYNKIIMEYDSGFNRSFFNRRYRKSKGSWNLCNFCSLHHVFALVLQILQIWLIWGTCWWSTYNAIGAYTYLCFSI